MRIVYKTMVPMATRPGWFQPGWSLNPEKAIGSLEVPDPDVFLEFMRRRSEIPDSLERSEYERLCSEWNVPAVDDANLNGYLITYGNFDMGHYLSEPENRLVGIAGLLAQARRRALPKAMPVLSAAKSISGKNRKCKKCGGLEAAGSMFTTLASSGLCDDCV
jgi:hypothetical protein